MASKVYLNRFFHKVKTECESYIKTIFGLAYYYVLNDSLIELRTLGSLCSFVKFVVPTCPLF